MKLPAFVPRAAGLGRRRRAHRSGRHSRGVPSRDGQGLGRAHPVRRGPPRGGSGWRATPIEHLPEVARRFAWRPRRGGL